MNIVNGKVVDSQKEVEIIRNFVERWEIRTQEIKKLSFDKEKCFYIYQDFLDEVTELVNSDKISFKDNFRILTQLGNDLHLALYIALSNFRKENKSLWNIFLSNTLKLPPLDFSVIKVNTK